MKPSLRLLALVGIAGLVTSCGGPFLVFPGGALSGELVDPPPADWAFVTARFVDLEVRPADPYSVELNYFVRDGKLYVDPAEGRRWHGYLLEDPNVRVRFHGKVYPLRAVRVRDPAELEGFDPERLVYRLDPR